MARFRIKAAWTPLRRYAIGEIVELDEGSPRWAALLPGAFDKGFLEKASENAGGKVEKADAPKQKGVSRKKAGKEHEAKKAEKRAAAKKPAAKKGPTKAQD